MARLHIREQAPPDQLQFSHELVNKLNDHIRGFKAVVSELWYVEEYDVLALTLNRRRKYATHYAILPVLYVFDVSERKVEKAEESK